MIGIININKPKGISSNKIVCIVKKKFNEKKVGHLGTLDPLASGVLPICLGRATKLFDLYLNKEKEYIANFTFGVETDTLDSEGKIVKSCGRIPDRNIIIDKLSCLTGKIEQMPPKYSAKNINGKRAYELARNGENFELKPKIVEIFKIELLKQINQDTFQFLISCSGGTYIRSIARDLGELCDTFAYMSDLVRTKSGDFSIKKSVEIDEIKESDIMSIDDLLNYEKIYVNSNYYDKLKNGNEIFVDIPDKDNILVYCNNDLFGIAECHNNKLKIKINLFNNN